ncbi:hypothetical protein VTN02DRAFT_5092 [Thermoascus thermophilus]
MSERPSKRPRSSSSQQEDEDNVRSTTPAPERTAVDYEDASATERLAHHQPRLPRALPGPPLHIRRERDLQDDSNTSSSSPATRDENYSLSSLRQPPLWQPPAHTVGQQGVHSLGEPLTGGNQRNVQRQPSFGYDPNDVPRIAVGDRGTLPPRWIIEADTESPPQLRPRTPERAAVRPEGAASRWTTSEETDETEADENEFDANNHGKFTTDVLAYEREPPTSMLYANARTPTRPGGRASKAVMNMFGSRILSGPGRVTQQPVASQFQPIFSDSSGSPADRDEEERWKEVYRRPPRGLGGSFDPEEDHQRELEEQSLAEEHGQMEPLCGKYRALWSVVVSSFVGMFVCLLLYSFGIIK